ncbi:MAG: hydroxyisourate hydrolase [Acidiferrobacteraceae bacterium]|nr:hydroxyisourate hydrolase [Acidiferrobacteraceae bacterium]|tara:strand:- start:1277 stop:1738 length:462 start_codon:yes stop_codon:yes gene_type:complete
MLPILHLGASKALIIALVWRYDAIFYSDISAIIGGGYPLGQLTTHVLDTAKGQPADGMAWTLLKVEPQRQEIASGHTNLNGRTDEPILKGEGFAVGTYELIFMVGDYFQSEGLDLPNPPFLNQVVLRFGISDDLPYHIPLLVSPYGYSTYRGS